MAASSATHAGAVYSNTAATATVEYWMASG
jgi:hypothetical protein